MPQSSTQWISHRFKGGWATDFGPTVKAAPNGSTLDLPYLTDATNVIYTLDGGWHTMPGTTKMNTTTLGASSTVRGIYDYWRQGDTGTAIQRVVVHVDTRIMAASVSDTTFTQIGTGFTDGAVPSYATFDDLLIIASDAPADVPKSWDQTTLQSLAGSPPNFSFSASHKNREWAAGDILNPSRLYYSDNLNPESWIGSTSGSIDIDPSDGDSIVGLASFRNELWVFKGPYKGSIHRISGTSPADFARSTFAKGITAAYHNSIFTLPNDLGFISPYGTVHSISSTDRFGDYEQSALSFPINRTLRTTVAQSQCRHWWAVEDPLNGMVVIGVTPAGQQRNTLILMMDYRFLGLGEAVPRWATWKKFGADAIAYVNDTGNRPRLFFGLNDGFVYKGDQNTRSHNASAITPVMDTPFLTYGANHIPKTLCSVGVEVAPKNDYGFTVSWIRDGQNRQTNSDFTQGGSDVLGPWDPNPFTLDTSTLGGTRYQTRYQTVEEGGEFRAIQYRITDTTDHSELEVHGFVAELIASAVSTEDTL
jgi:hypothetical protein